jgi:ribosomal protein L11 methyltransferase
MQYIEIVIKPISADNAEIVIALLAEAGYESFVEESKCLKAYIKESAFDAENLKQTLAPFSCAYTTNIIAPQNWNALWEASFEPVHVSNKVAVHASFHAPVSNVEHNIIITPKMSFGTGHHSTTHLMLDIMGSLNLVNQTVLDYGCGTGVLAIYAEKLGATICHANDIDTWCIENTLENIALNDCKIIHSFLGDLDVLPNETYHLILANINLHILQKQMATLKSRLKPNGKIIVSGILTQNQEAMDACIAQTNLIKLSQSVRNEWLAIEIGLTA